MVSAPVLPSTPRTTRPTRLWGHPRPCFAAPVSAAFRAISVASRELVLSNTSQTQLTDFATHLPSSMICSCYSAHSRNSCTAVWCHDPVDIC